MTPTIDELITWARGAGAILREGYGKRHAVNHKGQIDLVTEMDKRSETYLLQQIQSRYPDDTIFTEELGHLAGQPGRRWYIDPLDGTTNYAHAVPIFSVSIAYADENGLQLGVVYDPMRDECFSAVKGQGARRNGDLLKVSETQDLISSLLVTGFPYDTQKSLQNVEYFALFTRLSQGVRRMGSAALDLCSVAAGRFDGYWEITLSPWDLAAGALIVREAGGVVTNLYGSQDLFQPPFSILAANPAVHAQMAAEFRASQPT